MSANPPIPPDFKIPPRFSYRPLFHILYQQMRRETRKSPEIEALKLGEWAFLFLAAFQPPPGTDYIAAQSTPPRIQVFTWLNRTKALLEYLEPYLAEVRRDGTPEQLQYIRDIVEKSLADEEPADEGIDDDGEGEDEFDDIAEVDKFPEPAEAVSILVRIAHGYPSTSVEYTGLQITIRALRYLIDSGEAPEFMRYVDQMSKWVPVEDV